MRNIFGPKAAYVGNLVIVEVSNNLSFVEL